MHNLASLSTSVRYWNVSFHTHRVTLKEAEVKEAMVASNNRNGVQHTCAAQAGPLLLVSFWDCSLVWMMSCACQRLWLGSQRAPDWPSQVLSWLPNMSPSSLKIPSSLLGLQAPQVSQTLALYICPDWGARAPAFSIFSSVFTQTCNSCSVQLRNFCLTKFGNV